MKNIPKKLFHQIHKVMPLVCVDVVAMTDYAQVALIKRAHPPKKGELFIPGGRLLKGESVSFAAERIMREEFFGKIKFGFLGRGVIGTFEYQDMESSWQGSKTHTISLIYKAIITVPIGIEFKNKINNKHSSERMLTPLSGLTRLARFSPLSEILEVGLHGNSTHIVYHETR